MSYRPPAEYGYRPGSQNGYDAQQQQYRDDSSRYQAPTPQPQYWSESGSSNSTGRMNEYSHNIYYAPTPLPSMNQHLQQPHSEVQPQFISPAQLFQQAPVRSESTHSYQLSPISHVQTASLSTKNSAVAPADDNVFEVDTPMLLISLAEEYVSAAHKLAPSIAPSMTEANVEVYEKLIATGLGCFDTALKRVKLAPRIEAKVRLRYAAILYEETENSMEAETTLTKGIALCERNHYFDLKYAMQFLLAQFMGKKNPKASMKAIDSHVMEAQTYQQFSWVYAFRFLRASISVRSGSHVDANSAISNLKSIATLAGQQEDYSIHLAASLMEAMVHMKSTGPDAIQNVQDALARTWSNQLNIGNSSPQLISMAHIIQVSCSIRQGNPPEMLSKLAAMQKMMDAALPHEELWGTSDDTIAIPINRTPKSSHVSQDTRAILGIGSDGRDNLMMSLLSKKDAFSMTYLLCGMVLLHQNSQNHKAIKYLEEGLDALKGTNDTRNAHTISCPLPEYIAKNQWRGEILCYFQIYMAFSAAATGDWKSTKRHVEETKVSAEDYEVSLNGALGYLLIYLTGVYYQGSGDLETALRIYKDEKFSLTNPRAPNPSSMEQVERDIALLAALNTLSILQEDARRDPRANHNLITNLEPLCSSHTNRDIQTAFNLLAATIKTNPDTPTIKVKSYLRAALTGAQQACNTQFTCITLNVMCSRFFTGVVGPQAEKSAMAAVVQAVRSGNPLWRSVAEGMLGQCYEVQGRTAEGQEKLHQARLLSQKALPSL